MRRGRGLEKWRKMKSEEGKKRKEVSYQISIEFWCGGGGEGKVDGWGGGLQCYILISLLRPPFHLSNQITINEPFFGTRRTTRVDSRRRADARKARGYKWWAPSREREASRIRIPAALSVQAFSFGHARKGGVAVFYWHGGVGAMEESESEVDGL